jgi:hypothetical protein
MAHEQLPPLASRSPLTPLGVEVALAVPLANGLQIFRLDPEHAPGLTAPKFFGWCPTHHCPSVGTYPTSAAAALSVECEACRLAEAVVVPPGGTDAAVSEMQVLARLWFATAFGLV